ncbi:unnamed protein product [Effrenium voratum]|nr:unnamed protein product [Effrenium voratum]
MDDQIARMGAPPKPSAGIVDVDAWRQQPGLATRVFQEFARKKRGDLAQILLEDMLAEGLQERSLKAGSEQAVWPWQVNVFHCSSAAGACVKATQWQGCLQILSCMARFQVQPNEYTQSVTAKACAEASLWQKALKADASTAVSAEQFPWPLAVGLLRFGRSLLLGSTTLGCCGRRGRWADALWILLTLRECRGPDAIAWSTGISACEKGERWMWAQETLRGMLHSAALPNPITCNSLLSACQKCSRWQSALLWSWQGDTPGFNAAIRACSDAMVWARGLGQLNQMHAFWLRRSTVSYNSAIAAEPRAWSTCLGFVGSMALAAVAASSITANSVLHGLAASSIWQLAVGSVRTPDVVTLSSAISGVSGVSWRAATALFGAMGLLAIQRNVVAYTSAIGASGECDGDGSWTEAFALLVELKEKQMKPNELSCSTAISGCKPAWRHTLWLLGWMRDLSLSILPFDSAVAACASCSRPSSQHTSRFLSPGPSLEAEAEDAIERAVQAGREQNLRGGLVVAELQKRGVAECFEEYSLRDYFDASGQRRFCNLSMSVAARRHPQVSKAFGSMAQRTEVLQEEHVFSAIAYRKASAMVERDRQMHLQAKEAQYQRLAGNEKFRTEDVRRRQLELVFQGFPSAVSEELPSLTPGMAEEAMLPVEASSRQVERDSRKRCERHNVYFAERTPQTVFLVKRQGWIFQYDDVCGILNKLDGWMGAVGLTPVWGIDRSTFSQLLVDLDLRHEERLPYVWAHQVFDAYAQPMRLAPGDPDYDELPDGRVRSAMCVSRWDFCAVLDRLLRARFERSPREEFLTRLRAAYGTLGREWKNREEASKAAAEECQRQQLLKAQREGKAFKPAKELKASQRWKFDRHASSMLKEPEVMRIAEQFRKVFSRIFACYASEKENRHMLQSDLVSFCYDVCLVPDLVSRNEVQRVYGLAVCLDKPLEEPPSLSTSLSTTSQSSQSLVPPAPQRSSFKSRSKTIKDVIVKKRVSSSLAQSGSKASDKPKLHSKRTKADLGEDAKHPGLDRQHSHDTEPEAKAGKPKPSKPIFGVAAFAESLCRLIIGYLLIYGNSLQQTMTPEARAVWLVSYLSEAVRQGRSSKPTGHVPDWPGWRGAAWAKMLETLKDQEFAEAVRPTLQAPRGEERSDDIQPEDLRPSHRGTTPESEEDLADDSSELSTVMQVDVPSLTKDAPEAQGWLFARHLVCTLDLTAKKRRGSKGEKARRRSSAARP